MDLFLTEDETLIRDAAEQFLRDASPSRAVRAAAESETGFDADVWQRIGAELGWCALPVAEQYGGLGLGAVEMALLLEQMGRVLLCAPYFATVCLGATLVNAVGSDAAQATLLPPLAEGALRLGVALPDDALDAAAVQATASGTGWRLDGTVARVVDGASADTLLLFARIDDAMALFAVPRDGTGVATAPLTNWDGTRRFAEVRLDGVVLDAAARLDDPARMPGGRGQALALARLYTAAEQLGGAQQCLDLTVDYVATRKQFGRAVGGFQAVKHRCGEMMVRIEALRSAVYGAAAYTAGAPAGAALAAECAMAKALASDTYFWCAQEAIQLHGGVGFTWEFDPQLHFKRAQASSHWLGVSSGLRGAIADALFDGALV